VSSRFESAITAAISAVRDADRDASLYLYGSVATGLASPPESDIDLLTIGLAPAAGADIALALSLRFSELCRGVEVAAAQPTDFVGDTDAAYGGRVFLRHYCVHLAGSDRYSALPEFAADVRAARGFNGDITEHATRWRAELANDYDPVGLRRRLARKSLLAVAGLVSMHDGTWTTDRATAATRWGEIEPTLANDLEMLVAWSHQGESADSTSVEAALDGVVAHIAASFESTIGLWQPAP
jgi:hypothetical protein